MPLSDSILKRLYLKFIARKTTIYLIAILVFFYFLGLIIPQQSIIQPDEFAKWKERSPVFAKWLIALKLTSIYSSSVVIFLTGLFFLNLLLVTAKRVPAVIREIRLPESVGVTPDIINTLPFREEIALKDQKDIELVKENVRSKGFKVINGDGCFKGVKNNFSPVGSLFFHMSFIFILVGGVLIFHTRFWGETFVTEGQFFGGKRADYRAVSRLSELRKELPDIQFTVEKIEPKFEKMEPLSLKTYITAYGKGIQKTGSFDVNYPFKVDSTSILITDVGVAPLIKITDEGGQELFGAFVSLNVIRGEEDHFIVPETDYDVKVKFWPDYAIDDKGEIYTRSFYLKNPLFLINIFKEGKLSGSGRISSPSDIIEFDKKSLSIGDIRFFGRFLVIDEKGGNIIIAGFILSIIGLMIKLLWTRKEIYGLIAGEGRRSLLVGYKTEYFRGLGKEGFEKLIRAIYPEKDLK